VPQTVLAKLVDLVCATTVGSVIVSEATIAAWIALVCGVVQPWWTYAVSVAAIAPFAWTATGHSLGWAWWTVVGTAPLTAAVAALLTAWESGEATPRWMLAAFAQATDRPVLVRASLCVAPSSRVMPTW
jgi:hypothetical protein